MIRPESRKIGDILNFGDSRIIIPPYQRNFDWGRNEVQELVSDLKSIQKCPGLQLFLGNFIFNTSTKGVDQVVDGQQRITTISLLLLACRSIAYKNKDVRQAIEIQKKITFTDEVTGESKGTRVIVSPSIKELFEHICKDDWVNENNYNGEFPTKIGNKSVRRQVNKVKPIYDFIVSEVKDYNSKQLGDFLRALYQSYVILIYIENDLEAFDIFERTNARGLDLNIADLLKNFLFANNPVEEIEEKWDQIRENSENTLQRMIKYFWVSENGYVKKSDLYRKLKSYGNEKGADKLTDELYNFSRYYRVAQSLEADNVKEWLEEIGCDYLAGNQGYHESINRVFQALKLFKITQAYPLIYSIFISYKNSPTEDIVKNTKSLLNLLSAIEKYHFINNVICERVGNEIEMLYANRSVDFRNSKNISTIAVDFIKDLTDKRAEESEFVSRFSEITYSTSTIPLICYIYDRINNVNAQAGQRVELYLPYRNLTKRNFNTEHFMPQNPNFEISKETKDNTDNIGNLLVISRHSNSEFSNKNPVEKIEELKKPKHSGKLIYLKDFIEKYEEAAKNWDAEKIKERSLEIGKEGFNKVWAI